MVSVRLVTGGSDPALAALLRERRSCVLQRFDVGLSETAKLLSADPAARCEIMRQAARVFGDVCDGLVCDRTAAEITLPWGPEIGAGSDVPVIHPSESLRAVGVLFDIVLSEVVAVATGRPDAAELIARAAVLLQHSINGRIRRRSAMYTSVLLNEIHQAHVSERRRIARELHDRVGSMVGAAMRSLELYRVYAECDPSQAEAKLAMAETGVREALDSVRQVAADLRLQPRVECLEEAVRGYVDGLRGSDVAITVEINGDEQWVPPETIDELYFIVREALRNASEHAVAQKIDIRVDITPRQVRAVVTDDGVSFDPDAAGVAGAGIASMRERAALIAGRITISSWPGGGSVVEVVVPLGDDLVGGG